MNNKLNTIIAMKKQKEALQIDNVPKAGNFDIFLPYEFGIDNAQIIDASLPVITNKSGQRQVTISFRYDNDTIAETMSKLLQIQQSQQLFSFTYHLLDDEANVIAIIDEDNCKIKELDLGKLNRTFLTIPLIGTMTISYSKIIPSVITN